MSKRDELAEDAVNSWNLPDDDRTIDIQPYFDGYDAGFAEGDKRGYERAIERLKSKEASKALYDSCGNDVAETVIAYLEKDNGDKL